MISSKWYVLTMIRSANCHVSSCMLDLSKLCPIHHDYLHNIDVPVRYVGPTDFNNTY